MKKGSTRLANPFFPQSINYLNCGSSSCRNLLYSNMAEKILFTKRRLKKCMPYATPENIEKFFQPLADAMDKFEIDTAWRQAHFLAQLAHESGSLKYVRELASGEAYEGRRDLGNIEPGDGVRFKGRGLIQITGRTNYDQVGKALEYDFISEPEKLELPGAASYSAAWFWHSRELNRLADIDALEKITRRINGGLNGLEDRMKHLRRCKLAYNLPVDEIETSNIT